MRSVVSTRTGLTTLLALLATATTGCFLVPFLPDSNTPADGGTNDDAQNFQVNHPPVPNAGEDQVTRPGADVVLRGVGTTDPDGDRLSFVWRQIGGTPNVTVEGAFGSIARFTVPSDLTEPTILVFSLTVTDGFAAAIDQVSVSVAP